MSNIKNIIFDFGGVIIDIDYQRTVRAFRDIGMNDFEAHYTQLNQDRLFDELETGQISAAAFRDRIRKVYPLPVSDQQVDEAWNAILIDLPHENIRFLEDLRKKYRLFLLSNTNEIHELAFTQMIQKKFGEDVLAKVFEKVYLSHRLGMRKPDVKIFRHVMEADNLLAGDTLFVDDSLQHIEGAKNAGLQTFYFEKGKKLDDIIRHLA